jgi:hypothetical protein
MVVDLRCRSPARHQHHADGGSRGRRELRMLSQASWRAATLLFANFFSVRTLCLDGCYSVLFVLATSKTTVCDTHTLARAFTAGSRTQKLLLGMFSEYSNIYWCIHVFSDYN